MRENLKQKVALTIAGLDPSGGAGIIADIKTFTTFGCFATCAITSITFQNTTGVFGAIHQTADSVRRQIEPILDDYEIAAVKTGMLPTREIILEVGKIIEERKLKNVVVDPVVRSTSGFDLIDDEALAALVEFLFPLATVVTPNLAEAERVAKMEIQNADDVEKAASLMRKAGARNVLLKGGHLTAELQKPARSEGESNADLKKFGENSDVGKLARDYLFLEATRQILDADFIETKSTHGTGCSLASAIAAGLARGFDLKTSVQRAKDFVTRAIRTSANLGHGNPSVNHSVPGFDQ